jgi:hypothetical protein
VLVLAGGWHFWPSGLPNSSPDDLDANVAPSVGLGFDGSRQYIEVLNFNREVRVPFLVQIVATPRWQRNPANLLSWTGRNWVALFLAENHHWGLAWLHEGQSRLVVCREPAVRDQQCIVSAW